MLRRSRLASGLLPALKLGSTKTDFFTSLWNKPQTRDERVKEYVPEVLEESLEEQHAVLERSTSRDVIVELGHKILQEIDNKIPTPTIAPNLAKLLREYGVKDVIAQRPLSYLLYPNSTAMANGETAHELVTDFPDNFRAMIEEVERNGCSARQAAVPVKELESHCSDSSGADAAAKEKKDGTEATETKDAAGASEEVPDTAPASEEKTAGKQPEAKPTTPPKREDKNHVVMTPKDEYEPLDITMFVKVASGMALANLHCNDLINAVRCVDAGLSQAKEPARVGGLYALKAGILVRQKKYAEAAESARRAVEASGNVQGYLQGAYAMRQLHLPDDAIALLEQGKEDHPMNTAFEAQITAIRKEAKHALPALPALPASSSSTSSISQEPLSEP